MGITLTFRTNRTGTYATINISEDRNYSDPPRKYQDTPSLLHAVSRDLYSAQIPDKACAQA